MLAWVGVNEYLSCFYPCYYILTPVEVHLGLNYMLKLLVKEVCHRIQLETTLCLLTYPFLQTVISCNLNQEGVSTIFRITSDTHSCVCITLVPTRKRANKHKYTTQPEIPHCTSISLAALGNNSSLW